MEHTNSNSGSRKLSKCCHADVVHHMLQSEEESTSYYVCTSCHIVCDIYENLSHKRQWLTASRLDKPFGHLYDDC